MTLRSPSILSRILWLHTLALLATAVIVAGTVYLFLDSTADRLQREALLAHAQTLQRSLTYEAGRLRIDNAASSHAADAGTSFTYFVLDRDGAVLLSSNSGFAHLSKAPRERGVAYFREHSRRAFFSGISLPVRSPRGAYWIVVIQDLEHPEVIVDDILRQFLGGGAALIAAILLVLLMVDVIIVRRALRPVVEASAQVRELGVHDLDVRLAAERMPAEIRPLALAVNHGLDRVADGYRIQRDFIADAAHELRTPLAIARMRVDGIAPPEGPVLRSDLDAMARIVGQMLDIAAAENARSPLDEVADLADTASAAVAATAPFALAEGRTIELEAGADAVRVHGSSEMIGRALQSILENAVHHTRPGTHIHVSVSPDGTVAVADDGPGVRPEDRENIFRRFWRRDRSSVSNSGLGLAIAAEVARLHRTAVLLADTPGGGATFSMAFELVSRPSGQ